ncbi:MAG: lysX [Thermoleophilia bacterium]|nr:lysX [Thermoleophilia bacterium]
MTVALIGSPTRTNVEIVYAWRSVGLDARVLWAAEAAKELGEDDTAIVRLDVLPTLDGIEPGLEIVPTLEKRGVRILNRPDALLAAHDKLITAERLEDAGVPHPWTRHAEPGRPLPAVPFPCVLKPRFGSWGQDVLLCRTREDLQRILTLIEDRPWWRRHGALLQELVAPVPYDIRAVVAGHQVVACARRIAAPGEWRTNVTLGGRVVKAELPAGATELIARAMSAIGIDLAGVDLLPTNDGWVWVVLELNGAVDFDTRYALPGLDPYAAILEGLGIAEPGMHEAVKRGTLELEERKEAAMAKTLQGKPARPGDEIVITGHSVGDSPRTALILDVLGEPGHERFHVRWEDGHESIFFPSDDAVIRRPQRRVKAKT